jgi:hypothetical protein
LSKFSRSLLVNISRKIIRSTANKYQLLPENYFEENERIDILKKYFWHLIRHNISDYL